MTTFVAKFNSQYCFEVVKDPSKPIVLDPNYFKVDYFHRHIRANPNYYTHRLDIRGVFYSIASANLVIHNSEFNRNMILEMLRNHHYELILQAFYYSDIDFMHPIIGLESHINSMREFTNHYKMLLRIPDYYKMKKNLAEYEAENKQLKTQIELLSNSRQIDLTGESVVRKTNRPTIADFEKMIEFEWLDKANGIFSFSVPAVTVIDKKYCGAYGVTASTFANFRKELFIVSSFRGSSKIKNGKSARIFCTLKKY